MRRTTAAVRFLFILIALLLYGLLPAAVGAQNAEPPISVQARIDRLQMRVGDALSYELVVIAPPEVEVSLPEMPTGSFGEWEVRSCDSLPPDESPDDGQRSGWQCMLTIWTVGEHPLPVQEVRYKHAGGDGSLHTQPLVVQVVTVLDQTANDIKPPKPQLPMNDPANMFLIIGLTILALLVAAAVVLALIYYRRMTPVPALVGGPAPASDPSDFALRELERIARLGLVNEGRVAEHYVLIADTLRAYIRQLFDIPALERTTSEISSALGRTKARAQPESLVSLLAEADGVKFARYTPTPEEAHLILERARQAIIASRER